MSKISVVIIAKNEEGRIADCVDSVSFCDEIIVVDNNSSDKTPDIARMKGALVIDCDTKDFSKLRNIGLAKAKNDWLLYIDADERVSRELKENIQRIVKENNSKYSAYKISRKNYYLGNHEWPGTENLERLFKRDQLEEWYGPLHESPKTNGEVGKVQGDLLHFTHRNLELMLRKTINWSDVEAQLRYDSGHPEMSWWRFLRVMLTSFFNWYIVQKGWKLGTVGLIESTYQSFSMFITYAKLWEMQQRSKIKK